MGTEIGLPDSRTVFLTGASSGIGRATALQLAREGHRLALCSRRVPLLESLVLQLKGGAARHTVAPGDVTDPASVTAALDAAEAALGPLDTLLQVAGAAVFAKVEETTDDAWRRMLDANLTGLFYAVRAVVPRFRERRRGQIVAVLSVSSRTAFPGCSAYTAAKFGALGFLESVRAEVRAAGIHVSLILPGATDTPIWDGLGEGWDRAKMMPASQVAAVIASVLRDTGSGRVEEVRVMPAGGAL
jgi:NAD(P)-dependent dehydrogenase (short-subunit alcohol dehydrogenase family)